MPTGAGCLRSPRGSLWDSTSVVAIDDSDANAPPYCYAWFISIILAMKVVRL